jgi:hypothetical protein
MPAVHHLPAARHSKAYLRRGDAAQLLAHGSISPGPRQQQRLVALPRRGAVASAGGGAAAAQGVGELVDGLVELRVGKFQANKTDCV